MSNVENYIKTVWENAPSEETPVNAENLNNIENQVESLTNHVIEDNIKIKLVYKGEVALLVDLPSTNQKVGDYYTVVEKGVPYVWNGTEFKAQVVIPEVPEGGETAQSIGTLISSADTKVTPDVDDVFGYSDSEDVSSIINSTLELNEIKYKRQYKNNLNVWVDIDTDFIIINSNSFSSVLNHTLPYDVDKSYPTRILLKDKFDNQAVAYDTLPTSSIVMTWGKNGAGFGKRWERGAVDMTGEFWKNDILQPTIYQKKPSDPVPEDMQEGDILIVVNDTEAFSSSNFPQEFGTGYVWSQLSTTDIDYYYWTFMQSTSNSIIESFKASTFKGTGYPGKIFDADSNWDNYFNIPLASAPGVVLLKFKGEIQFNSFTLWGNQRGDLGKNSPKSFAFFGSMDGERWDSLYDTVAFADTNGTYASDTMNNSGNYYTYLMLVFRTNQNDNVASSGVSNAISIHDLVFDVSGYKYV